jgi:hypothetical protein
MAKSGLDKADGNIEVHPTDANIVFVAAMGNPFNLIRNAVYHHKTVENMAISSSKDEKPEPCVFVSILQSELFTQRFGKPIVTVILCHPEEKDLECTNRLMAVILGNRLTKNQECQLESSGNGNRSFSKFESLVCFDRKYKRWTVSI